MRVRPTELGFKGTLLLAGLLVAFLAASYSNLFFLIIAFCVVLGACGLWWTLRNQRRLSVEVVAAPAAGAGSERTLALSVASDRAVFDCTIHAELEGDGETARFELAHLPHLRGDRRLDVGLGPQSRGIRRIVALRCSSRFPFGLFVATRVLPADVEVVTYPGPVTGCDRTGRSRGTVGGLGETCRSPAVAGLRPFRTGDSPGDVHWKATARRGEPVVKERERETGGRVIEILVDRRCSEPELFETRLSQATATLLAAIENERPVQLRSQGFEAALDGNRPDPRDLLRWLATVSALPPDAAPPAAAPRTEAAHA